MFENFFAGRRVLITGYAGFKGSWLTLWLSKLGAEVSGISLLPSSRPRLYEILHLSELMEHELIADITDYPQVRDFIAEVKPEVVLHLAAQPLVLESYRDPLGTYKTNVLGTLNVLEACRACSTVKAVVCVTTDKCYENVEDGRAYCEEDRLGGYDLYSSSKACAEILTSSFRRSFLQGDGAYRLATARAGNVIGGGDFAKDRLVPDFVRALAAGKPLKLRHPEANRPWQFVLEPLAGYLALAKALHQGKDEAACAYNFGPNAEQMVSVAELAAHLVKAWGSGEVICEHSSQGGHEAGLLRLNNAKAKQELGVSPVLNFAQTVKLTAQWYQAFLEGGSEMRELTLQQIDCFCRKAAEADLPWSR